MENCFPIKNGVPAVVLAPMEGVTDAPMRALLTEVGNFNLCVTEFIRIIDVSPPQKVFLRHVPELKNQSKTAQGTPVAVQLLGGQPEPMAMAALTACQLGASHIDINFGCPAPTVNKNDGGATLLKFPHRIRLIVETIRKTLPPFISVSAKLRLGWDNIDEIHENARMAAEGGANWITIHGRTRAAGYSPPAHWKPMAKVKRDLGIPLIANGDIWNLESLKRCVEESECEHIMIGRPSLANPFFSIEVAHFLKQKSFSENEEIPLKEWLSLFQNLETKLNLESREPKRFAKRIKQWMNLACRKKDVAWFHDIKRLSSSTEIFERLSS